MQKQVCARQRGQGDPRARTQSGHGALAGLTSRHSRHSMADAIRPWAVAQASSWMPPSEDKGRKE